MKVVLALALITGANAVCTIKDVSTYVGIVGDSSGDKIACSGTTLANGATCNVKCDTGYACSAATGHVACPADSDTPTYSTLATTGCYANYIQSTNALKDGATWGNAPPAATAAGTCVACAANKAKDTANFANDAADTACATGCTYVDLDTIVGFEPDYAHATHPACVGGLMALSTQCAIKLSAGYVDGASGTLLHQCGDTAGVVGTAANSVAATAATSGCATGYVQSTNALKDAQAAKGPAVAAASVGTCVACTAGTAPPNLGPAVTQTAFGDTATACPDCTLTSMGTAGKCTGGCPVGTWQSAASGTNGATATCTLCDATKFMATGNQVAAAAEALQGPETEATDCGTQGCRADYYQTAGSATVAAVTGSDTVGTCTETIQSGAVAGTCLPKEPAYTKKCAAATINTGTAATDKTNCEAVKANKADGTIKTGTTAADQACNYVAATYVTQVTDCTGGAASKTACTGVHATKCTWTPSTNVAQVTASAATCAPCAAGKTHAATATVAMAAVTACVDCNPYVAGDCTTGCPADFYQTNLQGTSGGIKCTACAAGKTLANTGVLTTVQTADACTTPAAAASGSFRSVANAAATAVAASFAAAALM